MATWLSGTGFGTDEELKQQEVSRVFAAGNTGTEVIESDFITLLQIIFFSMVNHF